MTSADPRQRTYGFVELFESFRTPVLGDHDYFVEKPPQSLSLERAQLTGLEVREPFFVDNGWSVGPNRRVVPFVWDQGSGGQRRFSEAEAFTDYDSGHFGLAAVSAPTGEAQAQLYMLLARVIVDVHRANPALLGDWFESQGDSSAQIFAYFDQQRFSPEEKLLNQDFTIDQALWDARLAELSAAVDARAFYPHHIRWVEFLAHATDVPDIMGLIKAAQGPA